MRAADPRSRCLPLALMTALGLGCQTPPPAAVSPAPAPAPAQTPSTERSPGPSPVAPALASSAIPFPEQLACTDRTGRSWVEPRLEPGTQAAPAPTPAKGSPAERVLATARGEIRACYQAALNKDACTEGRTAFRLHVGADGGVERWCVGGVGTIATSTAVPCIASTLAGLRFDPPGNGAATVSGSFSFVNANAPPAKASP